MTLQERLLLINFPLTMMTIFFPVKDNTTETSFDSPDISKLTEEAPDYHI